MADSRVLIEIVSTAKGLKVVAKDTEKLAKNVEKTDKAYQKTEKSGRKYHKQEKAIHQSNLSSAKGFSKMNETMGSGSSGLVGAYATLAANVFAATAAFNALRQAAQVETLVEGFTFLADTAGRTSTIISNNIREITGNALSMEQAMRSSAIAITSGFSTEQFERLVEVGKNASIALGRNLADSVDRLTRGVAKLEPEILDELGILVRLDTATREYAAAIGKTATDLTDFERRQAFLNATIEQGEEKYSALSGSIDVNVFDKLAGTFANLTHNLLEFINTGLKPFVAFFANSQVAMFGAITFLAKGIISTMFPVLTDLGNRFAATAARSKEAANAMKDDTQKAFEKLQGGLGERGTQKGDPAGFQALVASAKKGTVSTKDLNSAMKSLSISESLRKKNLDKFEGTDLKNKKKELKRIRDLKKEVQALMKAEKTRAGASKGQISAAGKASRQGIIAEGAGAIGASSGIGGFKEAFKSMGKLNEEIKSTNKNMTESFGGGRMTKLGQGIAGGFKLASGGVRLFGAALINAIPLFGQLIFIFGVAKTAYEKFFGISAELKAAFEQLEKTLESQIDKYKTLEIVIGNLDAKQEALVAASEATTNATVKNQNAFKIARLEALKYSNEVKVVAGILTELSDTFEKLAKTTMTTTITNKVLEKAYKDIGVETKEANSFMDNFIKIMAGNQIALAEADPAYQRLKQEIKEMKEAADAEDEGNKFAFFGAKVVRAFMDMEKTGGPAFDRLSKALGGPGALLTQIEAIDAAGGSFAVKQAKLNALFAKTTLEANAQVAAIEALGPGFSELTKKVTAFADKGKKSNPFITLSQDIGGFEKKLKDLVAQEIKAFGDDTEGALKSAQSLIKTAIPQEALETFQDLGITYDSIIATLGDLVDKNGEFVEGGKTAVGVAEEEYNNHGLAVETLKEKLAVLKANLEIQKKSTDMAILQNEIELKNANLQRFGTFTFSPADEIKQAQFVAKKKTELANEEMKNKATQEAQQFTVNMASIAKENIGNQAKVKELQEAEKKAYLERVKQIDAEANYTKSQIEKARLEAMVGAASKGTVAERGEAAMEAGFEDAGVAQQIKLTEAVVSPFMEKMKQLGPEGELVSTVAQGAFTMASAITTIGDAGLKSADGMAAVGNIIGSIGSIMQANSKNQMAEIDKQIEAEKKRDGKSKESLAKIKAMEKEKEKIARKNFEMNKKVQIAQTIANTAAGVMKTMGDTGFFGSPLAMAVAAMGAAQVALIQKQTFQGGGTGDTATAKPQQIQIGKRNNRVDVSQSANAGELAYLRGEKGMGSSANRFTPAGAAGMRKGYSTGGEIMVGEQGPEVIRASGVEVVPNDKIGGQNLNANITINAIDAAGVEQVLTEQRGNIIGMIREAAHEHGEEFIEAVNTSAYGSTSNTEGGYG